MGLLLDTNIVIELIENRLDDELRGRLLAASTGLHVSVASLWEIAIKVRLGKLPLIAPLQSLPELIQSVGLSLLAIKPSHVLTVATPEPATRDPFDRLLLAQCMIEDFQLVTLDRVLASHPLAWEHF